jgi:hypothetical protein
MVESARRKESGLHTITVSIQGDVSVAESVEVNDAEALPLFVKLKAVLQSEETPKPVRRRGRPRKEKQANHDSAGAAPSQADEAADSFADARD